MDDLLRLLFPDGRTLPIRRTALPKVLRDHDGDELGVDDNDFDAWTELSSSKPLDLRAAFQLIPLAHKYSMRELLDRCCELARGADIPIEARPGLLQWLRLAEDIQSDALRIICAHKLRRVDLATFRAQLVSDHTDADVLLSYCTRLSHERLVNFNRPTYKASLDLNKLYPPARMKVGSGCLLGNRTFVCASNSTHAIEMLDTTNGRSLGSMPGHTHAAYLAASACDEYVYSGSLDKTVRVWGVESQRCKAVLKGHAGPISCIGSCAPGVIASGDRTGAVKVWDVAVGGQTADLSHRGEMWAVAATGHGQLLVSSVKDVGLRLWDLRTQACVRTMDDKKCTHGIATDAFGHTLVSGSYSGSESIAVWDLGTGRRRATNNDANAVNYVVMDDAATTAISLNVYTNVVKVWDVATAECTQTCDFPLRNQALYLCASPDLGAVAVHSRNELNDEIRVFL